MNLVWCWDLDKSGIELFNYNYLNDLPTYLDSLHSIILLLILSQVFECRIDTVDEYKIKYVHASDIVTVLRAAFKSIETDNCTVKRSQTLWQQFPVWVDFLNLCW